MSEHTVQQAGASPADLRRARRRALLEALGVALIVMLSVGVGIAGTWASSQQAVRDNYRHYLMGLAKAAAEQIDSATHKQLRAVSQMDGPDYARIVAPLRRLRAALPEIDSIFTVVLDGTDVRFIVDAAEPGDLDGNGVQDRAELWQLYEQVDPAMLMALGQPGRPGTASATDTPTSDQWGTFMTGYAPLLDGDGRQIGAVGVDVEASIYVDRIEKARRRALHGLIPAGLLITGLSVLFYRIRYGGLAVAQDLALAADEAQRTAAVLARERGRLRNVIESTRAGTWEWDIETGVVTINDRWAEMIGYRREDLEPVTVDTWRSLLHSDDADQARRCIEAAFAPEAEGYVVDFRMRHADGHWVWIIARGRVIERGPDGKPLRMVGTHQDITVRMDALQALKASEAKFRGLFEMSPVGLALNDLATGRFIEVNDALVEPTGYAREELLSLSYADITPPRYADADAEQIRVMRQTGRYGPYEKEFLRKDGSPYPALLTGICMKDSSGREVAWSIIQDMSQRKAMEARLTEAARCDRLTGLANRALFMERLQEALVRVQDGLTEQFAVLFLDFDHFKLVNDTMGHAAGDELLRQIAARLRGALRASDAMSDNVGGNLVARFGGDEFVILINELHSPTDATKVAERLLNTLAPAYSVGSREVYSTASIGIVTSEQCPESAEAVIRNADVAMYEAKRSGRGCSVVFNETMHVRLTRHMTIENSLRKALGTTQLSLVYQPIVALDSGTMVSAEALVRWVHPTLGPISPVEFIPIAEDSRLIVPLGEWVLQEACRTLAEWRRTDPARAPQTVSVNVSRAELALGKQLLERIRGTLERTGLPPQCLQLEVTEREVMQDPDACHDLMHQLRGIGVRLAMDDFGTGTSSLGCLRDYPFDIVKIDRSFVSKLPSSPDVLAVIHATITLVENLGMSSVAEGVEEASQVAILQSLGCRYAQGYFLSRPVAADQLLAALEKREPSRVSEVPPIAV